MLKSVLQTKKYFKKLKVASPALTLSILTVGLLVIGLGGVGEAATTSPPTTPKNLQATVVSDVQINLAWTASTSKIGIAGYDVYSSGTLIGTSITTNYSATKLVPKTKYKFTVAAYDTQGKLSSQSSAATATTSADSAPTQPSSLKASNILSTSLTLSWGASTSNVGVAGYKILRNGTQIATTSALTYTDSGLTNNIGYTYSVEAYDQYGLVSKAATVSATTQLPAPANLQAGNLTNTSVTLTWSQSIADPMITGYRVSRNGVTLANVTGTTYTDSTASPAQTYTYSVVAYNAAGNLSLPVSISATTLNLMPNAPTNLTMSTTSTTEAGLTWTATTGPVPASGYTVYSNGSPIGTTDSYTTNFFDTGLTPGTSYTFTVTATSNSGGVSVASAPLTITTGSSTTAITSCGTISSPGNYVLSNNIAANGSTCLTIQNTTNVTLDCLNNSITTLAGSTAPSPLVYINNVQNFMLVNCTVSPGAQVYTLSVQSSSNGFLDNDTFSGNGFVWVNGSNDLVTSNDTFSNSLYEQYSSSNDYIGNNLIVYQNYLGANLIISNNGSANTLDNNILNGYGGWTQSTGNYGFDTGIGISGESGDNIVNNNIQNTWDAGIETSDFVSNTLIKNNTINNTRFTGIGGWYNNSWEGNTVSNNKVSNADMMFYLYNLGGLPTGQTNLYFLNNTFTGNTATSPQSSYVGGPSTYIDMSPDDNPSIPTGSLIAGNNVFSGNNFGTTQLAPTLWPANMIVDGGGNICGAESYNKNSQLTCVN